MLEQLHAQAAAAVGLACEAQLVGGVGLQRQIGLAQLPGTAAAHDDLAGVAAAAKAGRDSAPGAVLALPAGLARLEVAVLQDI